MNCIKFKFLENVIMLDNSTIIHFEIHDKKVFLNTIDGIILNRKETVLTINDKILDLSKHTKIITDCFNLEISGKKNISLISQRIQDNIINEEEESKFNFHINELIDLCGGLFNKLDFALDYTSEIDLIDFLSILDLKLKYENSIIDKLILFIKLNTELLNIKLIFTVNIFSYLNEFDIEILKETLISQGITLIDFSHNSQCDDSYIEKYVLDIDNCLY